jgi:hypothetical protein
MSTCFVTFSDTLHHNASYFATSGTVKTDFIDLADLNGKPGAVT